MTIIEWAKKEVELFKEKQDGYVLIGIKEPTERVQMEAININVSLTNLIKNPTEKVIQAAILNGASTDDLMGIHGVDWNKISDELWLQIQLM